jgi:hypothetical protein
MFNTSKYLKDNVVKKVMKEKVGEVLSKVWMNKLKTI